MNRQRSFLPLTLLLSACASTDQADQADQAAQAVPQAPTVPAEIGIPAVAEASARAAVHNKRVLVVLNPDGEDLGKRLRKDRAVSRKLLYEVETVSLPVSAGSHWNWQQDAGGALLLSSSGQELARLGSGELAGEQAIAKLEPHFCEPADANQKLDDALAEAKKTGRNILIRFDAPW